MKHNLYRNYVIKVDRVVQLFESILAIMGASMYTKRALAGRTKTENTGD
jgi:hypothetical protein